MPGLPAPDGRTAVVLDGVERAVELARRGFQPVPLFHGNVGPSPAVDPKPVLAALLRPARTIAALRPAPEAPPAFLLDARRMSPHRPPEPGDFDNRWMVFPQDLPSAAFLGAAGVRGALLVQRGARVADDLAHVLRRWQEGGVELSLLDLDAPIQVPARLHVPVPSRFRALAYRMLALLGLRRSMVGGFVGQLPAPWEGPGGGGSGFGGGFG